MENLDLVIGLTYNEHDYIYVLEISFLELCV